LFVSHEEILWAAISSDQGCVQGDINRAPFASEVFDVLCFEKLPYDAFTGANIGAIKEVARILRQGGRLVIETGRLVPVEAVRTAMREQGFHYVQITDKGFIRSSGRLRTR
jgi:SAM-dependent methyltransferase